MTIIEKMYASEPLSEKELKLLATGWGSGCDAEPGEFKIIDEIEGDSGRWTKGMETIIQVGDDLWSIPWQQGLTEYQENEFWDQPVRVERKERVVTSVYYMPISQDANKNPLPF